MIARICLQNFAAAPEDFSILIERLSPFHGFICGSRGEAFFFSFMQQVSVAFSVELRRRFIKATACITDCLINVFEKDIHLLRPLLPVLLSGPFQVRAGGECDTGSAPCHN